MNVRTQILIAILVLLGLAGIVRLVKKNKIQLKYALPWCFLAAAILLLALFPQGTVWLAKVSGVGQHINIIFFLGFCFLLVLIFALTMVVSGLSQKAKRAIQELGILRERLDALEKLLENEEKR